MTTPPFFPGFDGLMTLSRREGVDIRPTLLRVLTDLYVQTQVHSDAEARQFVELTSRLIDEVDDTTRAAVRARLSIYPATPPEVLRRLGLKSQNSGLRVPLADSTGWTVIDFNRTYNPPCAFTAFSTCAFPPPDNRLTLAITAGEKRVKE